MKFTTATIIAAAAFLPAISAHLTMSEPKQWTVSGGKDNFPLNADGSDFPCHGSAPEASVAEYEPGSMQTLQLAGSATHGGGSGQMSITYEATPNKNTKFRVMTSFEGNHPVSAEGNGAAIPPIQFKVPAGLPAGKAVVAWTWFNRVGNREMYMQCATVTIKGSETSTAGFDALPEMFRANSGNGCTVPEATAAIKFKNPGPYIVGSGTTTIDCDNTQPGSGSGSSASSSSSGSSSSSSSAPTGSGSNSTSSDSGSSNSGSGSTDSGSSSTTDSSSSSTDSSSGATTSGTTDSSSGSSSSGSTSQETPASNSTAAAPSTSSNSTPSSSGGACTEGVITCNADGTWSLCGSGINQKMGAAPAGTTCKNGAFVKRSAPTVRTMRHKRYTGYLKPRVL
ncbi:hypothetical protein RUND412_000169 [Rhizina undulata]